MADTMKAMNLRTGAKVEFDRNTTATYAVAYGYCEDNGLLSALFQACHNNGVPAFLDTLPMHYGAVSVGCGDWAALVREAN